MASCEHGVNRVLASIGSAHVSSNLIVPRSSVHAFQNRVRFSRESEEFQANVVSREIPALRRANDRRAVERDI